MEKIKLPRHRVYALFVAIKSLDGKTEVVKDSDGKTHVVRTPYQYNDHKPIYAFAKTMDSLRSEVSAFETANKVLIRGRPEKPTPAEAIEFDAKIEALSNEETEVEVHRVAITDLKIHTNGFSPSVLADLMPMVVGEL